MKDQYIYKLVIQKQEINPDYADHLKTWRVAMKKGTGTYWGRPPKTVTSTRIMEVYITPEIIKRIKEMVLESDSPEYNL